MPSYVVEFKKKTHDGFTHVRKTVEAGDNISQISDLYNEAIEDGKSVVGLEFFTVRAVRPKPEPKRTEVKK